MKKAIMILYDVENIFWRLYELKILDTMYGKKR